MSSAPWPAPVGPIPEISLRPTCFLPMPTPACPAVVIRPDQTATFYNYLYSADGYYRTNMTATGQPDTAFTHIVDGVSNVVVLNIAGYTVLAASYDVASRILLSQDVYGNFDYFSRPQLVTHLDGTTEQTYYDCCGVSTTVNRDGLTTQYLYDAINRQTGYRQIYNGGLVTLHQCSGRRRPGPAVHAPWAPTAPRSPPAKPPMTRPANCSTRPTPSGAGPPHPHHGRHHRRAHLHHRLSGPRHPDRFLFRRRFPQRVPRPRRPGRPLHQRRRFRPDRSLLLLARDQAQRRWQRPHRVGEPVQRPCRAPRRDPLPRRFRQRLRLELPRPALDADRSRRRHHRLPVITRKGEREYTAMDMTRNQNGQIDTNGTDRITRIVSSVGSASDPGRHRQRPPHALLRLGRQRFVPPSASPPTRSPPTACAPGAFTPAG